MPIVGEAQGLSRYPWRCGLRPARAISCIRSDEQPIGLRCGGSRLITRRGPGAYGRAEASFLLVDPDPWCGYLPASRAPVFDTFDTQTPPVFVNRGGTLQVVRAAVACVRRAIAATSGFRLCVWPAVKCPRNRARNAPRMGNLSRCFPGITPHCRVAGMAGTGNTGPQTERPAPLELRPFRRARLNFLPEIAQYER